jgi:hypothetical protein
MQTRYRAAATALLLTATAGMAATGGAAEASGTHHVSTRAAKTLVITIHDKKSGITLSDSRFRPGNTIFKVPAHGKGSDGLQVLRLKKGYSIGQAFSDLGAAFSGDIPSIKRIDRNVVFYGGNQMHRRGGKATYWGIKIDKPGKYYVLDIESNALTTFKAKGAKQKRSLPKQDGWINAADKSDGVSNKFVTGKHNAAAGWMSSTNHAKEPHFFDVGHVKKSTTRKQVKDCLNGSGSCAFSLRGHASAGVVSPGKRMVWSYKLPKGKYLVDCFWPSKMTGMPHALMGMFKFLKLH